MLSYFCPLRTALFDRFISISSSFQATSKNYSATLIATTSLYCKALTAIALAASFRTLPEDLSETKDGSYFFDLCPLEQTLQLHLTKSGPKDVSSILLHLDSRFGLYRCLSDKNLAYCSNGFNLQVPVYIYSFQIL